MSAVSTSIRNELCEIARVVVALEHLAAQQQVPPSSIWPVNVALDEVLSNIINYG
jgi:anti-sigma regulatory factor (Ser/Thr protein kinase)